MDIIHSSTFITISSIIDKIWHYTLITVDNNAIKVSNIILATILFSIGVKYSQKVNNLVKQYIKSKLDTDKDTANALEKIAVYFIYTIYAIIALQIANVPLNAFAFVGGALVIGIGLGAQNLINNLISGLIVMVEKPIKIGDIIEIDDTRGVVTSINARCIIINNFANIDILVPNSKLLENNVINWTYNDSIIRSQLQIKVVHQSDHDIVMETIHLILNENPYILNEPPYTVYLVEISEMGAAYEINYYCDIKNGPPLKQIKSEVNFQLLKKFNEQNIEFSIYYYQYDLLSKGQQGLL
jgi:small-conductance mechanosensitive channel